MEISNTDRIIVLVDMDCFYVQVEQKLCPEYHNKPCAVVQYNTWKGGGIIAVNYEARAKGVTRMLRGDEAVKLCPDIHLFRVPEVRGKADLTRYRDAGALVLDVLCEFSDCVERASIDEAYLDMTSVITSELQSTPPVTPDQIPNTFVVGWEKEDPELNKKIVGKWLQMIYEEEHLYNDRMLAAAAVIVEKMRAAIYEKTGFRCSAGIAHNKMLAKLSCGIHKPNKQTILPHASIQLLFSTIPIKKVRNLGGKLGEEIVKKFNAEKMSDLFSVPKAQLISCFGEKTGQWLYNLARGIENEPVTSRQLPKSIGCGKNFPGKKSLSTRREVTHWLKQLASELEERLIKDQETNKRVAHLLTITVRNNDSSGFSIVSRSCPIHVYNADKLAHDALYAISKLNSSSSETLWKPAIWSLAMSASKFEDKLDNSHCNIESYFVKNTHSKKETPEITITSTKSKVDNKTVGLSANSENFQFTKNCNMNKSIAGFFAKKQVSTDVCCANLETLNERLENKLYEINNEQSSEHHSNNASESNVCNNSTANNDFINEENKETCNMDGNLNHILEKHSKQIGFFAKKLAERSEFCFNIKPQAESCHHVDSVLNGENSTALSPDNDLIPPSTSKDIHTFSAQDLVLNSDKDIYSDLDPELTKLCKQCNKCIPVWEEMEHLDYHMALNLSNELSNKSVAINNSLPSRPSALGKGTVISKSKKSGRKRGSGIASSTRSKKAFVQTNTLDAFIK